MSKECKLSIIDGPKHFHSAESCCKLILDKCSEKTLKRLQVPLEITYPEIFGKFDTEQYVLISRGSLPVVLLENASEFVSQMKNVPGFIEQIIGFIIKDNKKKYTFMGSHTFPIVIKKEWSEPEQDFDVYGENKELTEQYDQTIKLIKKRKKPLQAILHIGLEFSGVGHYGVAIKHGKHVIVFDSMQCEGKSFYTPVFCQIAQDVFGIKPKTLLNPTELTCPQITGGFVHEAYAKDNEEYFHMLQDLDSQNHFCYMWAIWYFHIFITKGQEGVEQVFDEMHKKCIPPLGVIKRYIWSVLHSFYPDDQKLAALITECVSTAHGKDIDPQTADFLIRFFMLNFRYIWDDLGTTKFHMYSIIECDLNKFRGMTNINECLAYSLEKFDYVLDRFTDTVAENIDQLL